MNNRRKHSQSFAAALQGIKQGLHQELHLKIHFAAAAFVVFLGAYVDISATEWCILLLCMGLVISLELVNSALERLSDKVTKEQDSLIKSTKDMAAGAVLIASIFTFAIGCIIFIPKFIG